MWSPPATRFVSSLGSRKMCTHSLRTTSKKQRWALHEQWTKCICLPIFSLLTVHFISFYGTLKIFISQENCLHLNKFMRLILIRGKSTVHIFIYSLLKVLFMYMGNTLLHLQELNSNQNMHIICSESRNHHSRQYFHLVNSFLSHNISAEIVHLFYCNFISCIGLHPFSP